MANVLLQSDLGYAAQPDKNFRMVSSVAGTNGALIKDSLGTVASISAFNTNAAPRFLKLYDQISTPTVGTDVPKYTFFMAAQDAYLLNPSAPLVFTTGIAIALTALAPDTDATPVGAGEIMCLNLAYN